MRLTGTRLRQIIKEEVSRSVNEMFGGGYGGGHRGGSRRKMGATPDQIQDRIAFYSGEGSRTWRRSAMMEYEDMAEGGDGGGIRDEYYPNWNNEDFQAVIDAVG